MPEKAGAGRGSSQRDRSHTLRDWARLYESVDELAARCQTGEAGRVLVEIDGFLAEARAAGVVEVLNRSWYVVALANLNLGDLDRAVDACNQIIEQGGEPGDPAWTSSAYALRGMARSERGDHLSAVDDLVDAAVLLDDARPTGQPYAYAVDGIGLGYLGLRLYELSMDAYQQAAVLVARPGLTLPRMFHRFHQMLVEICWGLELDRLDESDEAGSHFRAALAIAGDATPLPTLGTQTWALRMRALVGFCHAMTDAIGRALEGLESDADALAVQELDEEVLARIGLARAYGRLGDVPRALAEADQAERAAGDDHPLGLSIAWERQRLARPDAPTAATSVVSEYASRLERERWDDRVRLSAETRERLQSEIGRRAARRMSAEYLTDSLTGAANRRHLELRLPEMVSRARTHDEAVALAFVDLDADTTTEDMVSIGAQLRKGAGPDGFVARYGGSEFVVVLPRQTARQLADVVDDVVGGRRADGVPRPRVGVASARRPPSVAGLVAAADEALLAARRAGGGIQLATS